MALRKELTTVLKDENQSLSKRIQVADNAFRFSTFPLQHKAAVLIQWLWETFDGTNSDCLRCFHNWLKSDQFTNLTRNDINSQEFKKIINVIIEKIPLIPDSDIILKTLALESVQLLLENRLVQQFFRFNIPIYCHLILSTVNSIQNQSQLKNFLNTNIFFKNLIFEEKFVKYFFDLIMPSLICHLIQFKDDSLFSCVSEIVQKCIFHHNHKGFSSYILQYFESDKQEAQSIPKYLFKYLLEVYKLDKTLTKIHYKLIFHAFSSAYKNDFQLIYKFLILIVHIIGFDLRQKLVFHKVTKLKISDDELSLSKSQEIILAILDTLANTSNELKCAVKEITFKEFLTNILFEFLRLNIPSGTGYKIFIQAVSIDPLLAEALVEEIVIYAMTGNNTDFMTEYNEFIIYLFDIYSKMHRIESLVSKMVQALSGSFSGKVLNISELYVFKGKIDIVVKENVEFEADNILTPNILMHFSKCICGLASWQVINVFNTLLYHLHQVLHNIEKLENDNIRYYTFLKVLSNLMCTFLSSLRVAEYTVTPNVVQKCRKCLEELKTSLRVFGIILLKREHSHILVWSFLNISYHWGEIFLMLKYYTDNIDGERLSTICDLTSADITYLHSYLTVKEWHLISERISNFGERPCKQLLHKLFVQKIRAMHIFENPFNDDITKNVVRSITAHLEHDWKDLLEDKFIVKGLLQEMMPSSIITLADNLVNNIKVCRKLESFSEILDSPHILNAVHYVILTKINKVFLKQKRKHNGDFVTNTTSSKILAECTEELFLYGGGSCTNIENMKNVYNNGNNVNIGSEWKINEGKLCDLLEILKEFPVIFGSEVVQKILLLYLFSLHRDIHHNFSKGNSKKLQTLVEYIIIGILQQYKSRLGDIFKIDCLCLEILDNFIQWEPAFTLVIESVFKNEDFVNHCESLVSQVTKKLLAPVYIESSIIIMNTITKVKKSKMPKELKNTAENYKTIMCDKIVKLVSKQKPQGCLLAGYSFTLHHYFSQNNVQKLPEVLDHMNLFIEFALNNSSEYGKIGYLSLFLTVLRNKSKIKDFNDDLVLKIWNACRENGIVYTRFEEYSQLIVLIAGHVPNEKFPQVTNDLLCVLQDPVTIENSGLLEKYLRTWEAVLSCNLNPTKTKILQSALETLLQKVLLLLQGSQFNKTLCKSTVSLQKAVVQTTFLNLTPAIVDLLILSITVLMQKENDDFQTVTSLSISMLLSLLRYRKPFIMDRLPPYLQQFRFILKVLCRRGNSDLNLDESEIRQITDCAHQMEKLARNLIVFQKDMGRITMYLIADILEQYEQVTLYPSIKVHLNNCIYSLISICDQHAVTYLLRVLPGASNEIFKIMLENYKKYFRFTGKI